MHRNFPANEQSAPAQSIQAQLQNIQRTQGELFRLTENRTRDMTERLHKVQNDLVEIKLFLRTRLGAPDSSRLKDIMKQRLEHERFNYK